MCVVDLAVVLIKLHAKLRNFIDYLYLLNSGNNYKFERRVQTSRPF